LPCLLCDGNSFPFSLLTKSRSPSPLDSDADTTERKKRVNKTSLLSKTSFCLWVFGVQKRRKEKRRKRRKRHHSSSESESTTPSDESEEAESSRRRKKKSSLKDGRDSSPPPQLETKNPVSQERELSPTMLEEDEPHRTDHKATKWTDKWDVKKR
jgi:hypothetical protein